ncbi:MAG: hypothetical protein FJX34_02500 [Alphaproteobacteria bacterium]|nr:hypothetical protein [Alphaproteobacteria bacterium]
MKKLLVVSALLLSCSCSTMYNSGSQTVTVSGNEGQEGVSVEVRTPSGSYRTKLPATVVTSPSTFNPTTITVVDKCYENRTIEIGKSITPAFWANVFNYCVGCIIDPLTGAMWKLDNNTLVPLEKSAVCRK